MHETQNRSLREQVLALLRLNEEDEYSAADVVSELYALVEHGGPRITTLLMMYQVDDAVTPRRETGAAMTNDEGVMAMQAFAAAGARADKGAAHELVALKARIEEMSGRFGGEAGMDGLDSLAEEITSAWACLYQAGREAVGDERRAIRRWALELQMRTISALEDGDVPEGEVP